MKLQLPEKLGFLVGQKARYKVAYGGRGAGKSWSIADALLALAVQKTLRILCTRELQNSIRDSVHRLLSDRVAHHGLVGSFEITDNEIRCQNGSMFLFKGLRSNPTEIKSLEGIDIVWVEEAEKVSQASWDVLLPTIRKPGSEIWVSFNTGMEDDPVYAMFITDTRPDSIVVKINWYDNPWFPDVLDKERLADWGPDPNKPSDKYLRVWEGEPRGGSERVFPTYNETVHRKAFDFDDLMERGNFFCAMDPHKVYYPFIAWGVKLPAMGGGNEYDYVIYNEFPTPYMFGGKKYHEIRHTVPCTLSLKQISDMIRILDGTIGNEQKKVEIIARGIDTRFAKGAGGRDWSSDTDGVCIEWARPENGGLVWTQPDERDIDQQFKAIEGALFYNDGLPVNSMNAPRLYVMPHCENVNLALKFHRYNLELGRQDERHKCVIDTLRILFAVMQRVAYKDPRHKNDEVKGKTMGEQLKSLFFSRAKTMVGS